MKKLFASRRFRHGSLATVLSIVFLAIIIVINVIATVLVDKFPLDVDLTRDSVFALSDESKQYISSLSSDVKITVLADEQTFASNGTYFAQTVEVLNNYAKNSNKITVSYVDIIKNPTFTAAYPDLELTSNSFLVECGGKSKTIQPTDLFNLQYSQYGTQIQSSKAEQVLTSAIMYVTSQETIQISLLTGHNEYEMADFVKTLEDNNYSVVTQNLVTEEVDPNSKVAIIFGPKRDFEESELKKIDSFLINGEQYGKNLFYFADSEQPDLPNVNAFLKEWGLEIGDGVVFETDNTKVVNFNPYFAVVDYESDEFAANFISKKKQVTMPFSRPVNIVKDEKSGLLVDNLLNFSATAGVRPSDAAADFAPTQQDASGPIGAAAISTKQRYEGTEALDSNVVVFGSLSALETSILQSTSFSNSEYVMNLFNVLSEKKDSISISEKVIGGKELGINTNQAIVTGVVFVIVVPVIVLVVGIVIWVRRRNK